MSARKAKRRQVALLARRAQHRERRTRTVAIIAMPAIEGELVEPMRRGYHEQTCWGRMPLEGEYSVPMQSYPAGLLLAALLSESQPETCQGTPEVPGDGEFTIDRHVLRVFGLRTRATVEPAGDGLSRHTLTAAD